MLEGNYKLCPHCENKIKDEAIKCRHCKALVSDAREKTSIACSDANNKRSKVKHKPHIYIFTGILLIFIIYVAASAALNLYNLKTTESDVTNLIGTPIEDTPFEVVGNSAGNLNNFGFATEQDGWFYYYSYGLTGKILKSRIAQDGSILVNVVLSDLPGMYLNVVGNSLYFVFPGNTPEELAGVYRVSTDGTNLNKILDYPGMPRIIVIDDWIYFNALSPPSSLKNNIYKMRTDGTDIIELYDGGDASNINVSNGWVYFNTYDLQNVYKEGTGNIYKISVDGTGLKQLTSDRSVDVVVEDGWIYYSNHDDGMSIYKVDINGSKKAKVFNSYATQLNIVDGWIYFTGKDGHTYRVDTNGDNRIVVNNFRSHSLNIVGDWLYFIPAEGQSAGELSYKNISTFKSQTITADEGVFDVSNEPLDGDPYDVIVDVQKGSNLNLRNGPGENYEIIGKLPKDTMLMVIDIAKLQTGGAWYEVYVYDTGATGWVSADYVRDTASDDFIMLGVSWVEIDGLELRSGPGSGFDMLDELPKNTMVVYKYGDKGVRSSDTGVLWLEVETPSGRTGWVQSDYLRESQ